jgi:hydroxypyruvate isomerase
MAVPAFKLRYASHLGILSADEPLFKATLGTRDPVAHIEYAAAMGFAGIEDNFLKSRPVEEQTRMGAALVRCGMEMGCFAGSFNLERPLWGSTQAGASGELRAEIIGAIETAKRVGGRYIVIAASRDLRIPLPYQHAAMVEHLRRLAPLTEKAGVILCLEQTNEFRLPGMLLHHIADAYAVVRAVDSPAVKLLFDFFHVQIMDGNILDNLNRVWSEVAILQIADVPGRAAIGTGEINWVTVLRTLRAKNYKGLVEYEVFPREASENAEHAALEALRRADAAI